MNAMQVASSPHLSRESCSTRRMMLDVLIALTPPFLFAVWLFGWYAVYQVGLCVLTCLVSEYVFTWMRGKRPTLGDFSAVITGMILGLSLPWSAPWYVPVFGSMVAIGLGKVAYGGLGFNIFNPAMVGRAFVMLSFATAMGSGAYLATSEADYPSIVTQPTPMMQLKSGAGAEMSETTAWQAMLLGKRNGSLGEVSVLAILLGGTYLVVRRTASWRVVLGMLGTVFGLGMMSSVACCPIQSGAIYLLSGAVLFGAFFIATDPVTNPVTPWGQWIFGIGTGALTMLIRVFSGYPEGVMFAVLIMNALVPMINNGTIPKAFGAVPPTGAK
ncbi:MAG: RnfABCDGE type electron transport complex subunit D [Planctomycetia bacterium]|nr:RnfABCDGE type electron transport complex subunit D [Planctomycetia bacterium]